MFSWISNNDNTYESNYCTHCEVYTIKCPECNNSSCSGGGCDYCHDDFSYWLKNTNHAVEYYLTEEENKTYKKSKYLHEYIKEAIQLGFDEIPWGYFKKIGKFSRYSEELFGDKFVGEIK